MGRFEGRVAVITGGASGIGAAAARRFHGEGASVVLADLNVEAGEALAAELGEGRARFRRVDVAVWPEVEALVTDAVQAFGGLDILFNNAGVSERALLEAQTDAMWDRQFEVNVRAAFRLCREAVPALRERAAATGRARIVNTASVMAERTDLGLAGYVASKHAVAGLSKTLALELGKWGITVNYLLPGAIETGMTRAAFEDPAIRAVWAKKAALRRLGTPMDMARVVLLLASDEADFITGHGLVADGGLTLRT